MTAAPPSNIVVGVDGSCASRAALIWAAHDAMLRAVPLTLVNVNPLRAPAVGWGPSMATLPHRVAAIQEANGRRILTDAVRIADETTNAVVPIQTVFRFAPVARTLIELSAQAQMVVVGSRGRGPVRRSLLGSVTAALIEHAHCPVAVVHEPNPASSDLPVLVGIDDSASSQQAAAIAFAEASRRGVSVTALQAWIDVALADYECCDDDLAWEATRAEVVADLREQLAPWRQRYPDIDVRLVIRMDDPATHLIHEAEADAQLVVVGGHGRGGFRGMLLGSVSRAVVYASHIPVIVAREH